MSFILDALKKAESERSRQSGPVLMDVRIAAPRRRLPTWAWVLGGVLVANLAVLAWLLLRDPAAAQRETAAAAPVTQIAAAPPAIGAPPAASALPTTAASAPPATATIALPQGAPIDMQPAPPMALPEPPGDVDNLPTAQDLLASGATLPTLQLNLHVYDPAPANRYVLLNSVRLREGEFTPDGIKVERITPRGVVLDARGRRFLLTAGG
jgi:general secretion pathway protein B